MRTTFLDPELDAALDRDGYVVVPLIDEHGVERLLKAYSELGVAPGDPQRACVDTFHCFDAEYKQAVHEEVESVIGPAVQEIFDRYKSLSFCYIQKWPGERSAFGLHQDISVVDETQYRSVEVWCALHDTDEVNGQLWVVPGSHRWNPEYVRGIHNFPPAYRNLEERILRRHSIPVPVKAGEAVIFCHSLVHFSYQNRSDSYRLVAATDMIPVEARHLHWVANERGTIDEFEIDESFWVEQNPFTLRTAPDNLRRVGEVDPARFRQLTDEDLDRLVAEGAAIDHDPVEIEQLNDPDLKWCHRCGTTDGVDGHIDPWNGNVTLLCPKCEAAQARMAGVVGEIDQRILDELDRDGYTVVDLFDDETIAAVRQLVDRLGVPLDTGFYTMNRDAPRDLAVEIDVALQQLGQPAIDRVLPGYRVAKAIPIIKGPVGDNSVDLHQDWEYVDERYHRGFSVWCVLGRTGPVEGGMQVIPGSHRWIDNHRGSGGFPDPFEGVRDEIIRRGSRAVPLERGQAVIYDNAILHHTPPNRGSAARVAIAMVVAPPQAPVIHMHATGDGSADVFQIPFGNHHFTEQEFGSRPKGDPVRTVDISHPPVTLADLDRWLPPVPTSGDRSSARPAPEVNELAAAVTAAGASDGSGADGQPAPAGILGRLRQLLRN